MDQKTMNTEEYLAYLTREEKRAKLEEYFAESPEEKRAAKRKAASYKRLIKHVRKLSGFEMETAERKTNITLEDEEE